MEHIRENAEAVPPSGAIEGLEALRALCAMEAGVACPLDHMPQARRVDGAGFVGPKGPVRSLEELWDDSEAEL